MASYLDTTVVESIGYVIFPFLLVFLLTFSVLEMTNLFKNKGVNSLIAIVLAFMSLLFPVVRDTINMMTPWYVLLVIFAVFLILMFMVLGAKQSDVLSALKSHQSIKFWVIGIVLVITLGSLVTVVSRRGGIGAGEDGIEVAEGEGQESAFWQTVTNSKILGLALVFMIASFAVRFLTTGEG